MNNLIQVIHTIKMAIQYKKIQFDKLSISFKVNQENIKNILEEIDELETKLYHYKKLQEKIVKLREERSINNETD